MIKEKTYIIMWNFEERQEIEPLSCYKAKLKKGEVIQRSKGGVTIAKWKDKRDVLTISKCILLKWFQQQIKEGKRSRSRI